MKFYRTFNLNYQVSKKILLVFFLFSCSPNRKLGANYVFNDDNKRKMVLSFNDDSTCLLKNIYYCNTSETFELLFNCKYKILSNDYLLLLNNNKYIDTTGVGYFNFINSNKMHCDFLVKKEEKNTIMIGPNYLSDFEKYSKIPYIGYDTLLRYKNRLHWVKKNKERQGVGYYIFN